MRRRQRHPRSSILVLALLLLAGCQPACRYPAAIQKDSGDQAGKDRVTTPPGHYIWREPFPTFDVPLQFVDASRPEWQSLPEFWNHQGRRPAATVYLGLSPLGAAAAIRLAAEFEVVKIKVPLGLPDPTGNIPAVNPPTLAKWRLGKRLFFDNQLLPGVSQHTSYACADCHKPEQGWTTRSDRPVFARWNAPTLLNCVYNKHQFWDGRATYLEEVIQRKLADESLPGRQPREEERPEYRHAWPGVIGRLRGRADYLGEFQRVFGTDPTQDNIAKALATYLRTIFSGNAVYDRAEVERRRRAGAELEARDFAAALDRASLKALTSENVSTQQAGVQLYLGYRLFQGKGRCAACHTAPLFTDNDFHNDGVVGESDSAANSRPGDETGYFRHAPPGLKDRRYIGAFKTPTLRALPRTAPYMHTGRLVSLKQVLLHYKNLTTNFNRHLDPILCDGMRAARALGQLDDGELRALELFLRSLDGEAVAKKIAEP